VRACGWRLRRQDYESHAPAHDQCLFAKLGSDRTVVNAASADNREETKVSFNEAGRKFLQVNVSRACILYVI
jgi:hypothetical protein